VIGSLPLPPRADTPQPAEFTQADRVAEQAAEKATATAMRKTLQLITKTRQLRRAKHGTRMVTVKVAVQSQSGRTVRSATVKVTGGKLTGAHGKTVKVVKTDRKGRATLHVRLTSKKQVTVNARRKGYQAATLLIPVAKR
jgi:hypothetical protein